MQEKEIVNLGGREIECEELTAKQVDQWLKIADEPRPRTIAELLIDAEIPQDIVEMSTGLKHDELSELKPTELQALWQGVEKANPFFLPMVRHLVSLSLSEAQESGSDVLSAASSVTDTSLPQISA